MRTLIDVEPDLEVVADVCTGSDVLPAALQLRPDVALPDLPVPGSDGSDAAARLLADHPVVCP